MAVDISGWASTTQMDMVRHVVAAGAFSDSIRKRGLRGPGAVRLLAFHDTSKPLGVITKLEQRDRGLWLEATIEDAISYGKDIALAAKAAGGLNFSVGFFLEDADIGTAPDGGEYLHILKGDLFEVSVVTFPANPGAAMSETKNTDSHLDSIAASLARMKLLAEDLNRRT